MPMRAPAVSLLLPYLSWSQKCDPPLVLHSVSEAW